MINKKQKKNERKETIDKRNYWLTENNRKGQRLHMTYIYQVNIKIVYHLKCDIIKLQI